MIQLITVAASILLGMIIYPILMNKYKNFISNQYKKIGGEVLEKENKIPPEKNEKPSFVGESKFKVGHSQTKVATNLETEKAIEKAPTFVPPIADSDPEIVDVEVPLEKIENLSKEEFDPEEEGIELETDQDAVVASGASFEELMNTTHTIVNEQASIKEKETAGRVLYENQKTDLFEQLASGSLQISNTIPSLIDLHLAKRAERLKSQQRENFPNDFKDFDINSIF